MKIIDINCDMGESIGAKKIGDDEAIMPFISSANIACGFHGGDPSTIRKTFKLAHTFGVAVGAHPSFYDVEGFGRREMYLSAAEIYDLISYQISALKGMVEMDGGTLHHVKPHGALYNMASRSIEIANAISDAVYDIDPALVLYGLSNSQLIVSAKSKGLLTCSEVFADRTYQADGSLTPRTNENAIIKNTDDSVDQVLRMVLDKNVKTIQGDQISIDAETVCIHGDHEGAADLAKKIMLAFKANGFIIQAKKSQ